MRHSRIIADLAGRIGGQKKLAARLRLDDSTICHWKNDDGIPPRHWWRLMQIAKSFGYPLSLESLAAGPAKPNKQDLGRPSKQAAERNPAKPRAAA